MVADKLKVSVIIVSYNTKDLLKRCFDSVRDSAGGVNFEIIVVDNGSKDGSAEFIKNEFPGLTLIQSSVNLGFAKANNLGYKRSSGEYIVMLNSDAFLVGEALAVSVDLMDRQPEVGLAGGRLIGEDGSWQPSARSFPGIWNEFLTLSGLAGRYRQSRIFGRPDMTYIDQNQDISCDWVPGAFTIIRRAVIEESGFFDERFFLYYEEVDLCRRIKKSGWKIAYWPAVTTIHLGGVSAGTFSRKLVSKTGKQMGLWRLQSQYLYYRKNHGLIKALLSKHLESMFNKLRLMRNASRDPEKAEESRMMLALIRQAWTQTKGGTESPPRPWKGV
jgi:GT2 family glycosyltransferase